MSYAPPLASEIITKAFRRLSLIDPYETIANTDPMMTHGVATLNDMLVHEFAEAGSAFQVERVPYNTKPLAQTFSIGLGNDVNGNLFDVQRDAQKVRTIYYGVSGQNRYELRLSSESHIFGVTVTGSMPVRWMPQQQPDGSILCYLWPTPNVMVNLMVSIAKRVPPIAQPTDPVLLPPDSKVQTIDLLAWRLRPTYGVPAQEVADVKENAERAERLWKTNTRADLKVRLRRRRTS